MPLHVTNNELLELRKQVLMNSLHLAASGTTPAVLLAAAAAFEEWLLRDPDAPAASDSDEAE